MIAPVRPVDDRGGLDYLGPEFLTWLWWRADTSPCFTHEDGAELFVHFDEHLEFRGERSAARRTILRTGMPGASAEARAALRSGKVLVAARVLMARGDDEVRFTLRAEDLDLSGVKLPAPDGDTPMERLEACLESQDQFVDDLDLCLATFLEVRLGEGWPAEVESIRTWGARPSQDELYVP